MAIFHDKRESSVSLAKFEAPASSMVKLAMNRWQLLSWGEKSEPIGVDGNLEERCETSSNHEQKRIEDV